MARKSGRAALVLTQAQRVTLKELAGSRTAPKREVERARVLLGYADGASITELQRQLGVGRPMIYKCIDKALAAGVQMGLKDKYHRPHEPEISDEAKAWGSIWHAPSPRIMGWRPSGGRSRRWPSLFANAPRPQALPAWPTRARAPCGASSTTTTSSPTRFATTWKSATRISIARCRRF